MTDEKEPKKYVDLGMVMPMRKKKVTTAIEVALFHNGVELDDFGYQRSPLDHMRTMFMPSTGEMVFEIAHAQFGEVRTPVKFDAVALMARDAVFSMQRVPSGAVEHPGGNLELISVRWMKVGVVPG